ncbi:Retrovirus-related Pol polyprotein from transposon TNT 1-94 [Gossypium australe]|uniref:Retrovirus-related Pol polyprotein from transposon TNT 1-94 n=1 Tax=Gossypium australe TaxID=47621 RepID=A0A5B6X4F8_9ROSI|nr:Retrovirus-related Pol polyprotein from transposon TNT 1-94 [Gossypium australe]
MKADGSIDRYKCQGYAQKAGLDFQDTFNPLCTMRTIIALAVTHNWSLRQIDINNAFLNGDLVGEVYTIQPPGFEQVGVNGEPLIHVSIWPQTSPRDMLKFVISVVDPSLFIRTCSSYLLCLVYVDDIIFTEVIQRRLTRHNDMIHLSQRKCVNALLHKANMLSSKSVPTPMITSQSTRLVNTCKLLQTNTGKLSKEYLGIYKAQWLMDYCLHQHSTSLLLLSQTLIGVVLWRIDNLVDWSSKKQSVGSRSTSEAEYRSIANAAADLS